MVRVIHAPHLLVDGDLPPFGTPAFRSALQLARFIEYGGPLAPGQLRETLVACTRRPNRKPCPGLYWVAKRDDGRLEVSCPRCRSVEYVISGWDETLWAAGPMTAFDPREALTH